MITIKDIAKKAGVSIATVSYVLNETRFVSTEKKERVLKAIEELDYVPNDAARRLRSRKSMTIGLVVSDITNPFYPDLAKSCAEVAKKLGYTVVVINTNEVQEQMLSAITQLREGRVDGLIIASALDRDLEVLAEVKKAGYPIVLAHRRVKGLEVDSVVADNFTGSYSSIRHLLTLGHKKIGMVTGFTDSFVNQERVQGYIQAMKESHLQLNPNWIVSCESQYEQSYTVTINLLGKDERPTAIVASSDIAALGVMDAAQDMGLQIPKDLAIVGFDDLLIASLRSIQLSTVKVPRYQIGEQATRLLLDRISRDTDIRPTEVILPTTLVIRRTCGALPEGENATYSLISNRLDLDRGHTNI